LTVSPEISRVFTLKSSAFNIGEILSLMGEWREFPFEKKNTDIEKH